MNKTCIYFVEQTLFVAQLSIEKNFIKIKIVFPFKEFTSSYFSSSTDFYTDHGFNQIKEVLYTVSVVLYRLNIQLKYFNCNQPLVRSQYENNSSQVITGIHEILRKNLDVTYLSHYMNRMVNNEILYFFENLGDVSPYTLNTGEFKSDIKILLEVCLKQAETPFCLFCYTGTTSQKYDKMVTLQDVHFKEDTLLSEIIKLILSLPKNQCMKTEIEDYLFDRFFGFHRDTQISIYFESNKNKSFNLYNDLIKIWWDTSY